MYVIKLSYIFAGYLVCLLAINGHASESCCPTNACAPGPNAGAPQTQADFACCINNNNNPISLCNATNNTITLSTVESTIDGDTGLPSITYPLTVLGGTINTSANVRIFHVGSGGNFSLSNMTLTGGTNTTGEGGGAIFLATGGGLGTILDTTFNNNRTQNGGNGGAIFMNGSSPHSTIQGSIFSENSADGGGGAIYVAGSIGTITFSTLNNNEANHNGGAIELAGSITTINRSNFHDNVAVDNGGAISVEGAGSLTNLTFDTFENNLANNGGALDIAGSVTTIQYSVFGGITDASVLLGNQSTTDGGAINIEATGFVLTIDSSDFSYNQAINGNGGAINLEPASLKTLSQSNTIGTISNGTFFQNRAGSNGNGLNGGALNVGLGQSINQIFNTTFNQNFTLAGNGGAMAVLGTIVTFDNNTVDQNYAFGSASFGGGVWVCGTFNKIISNIFAGNLLPSSSNAPLTADQESDFDNMGCPSQVGIPSFIENHNLMGSNWNNNRYVFASPTDYVGAAGNTIPSFLEPLADNGGPTRTMALNPISVAHTTGANPLSLLYDQRGNPFARVVNNHVDMGAYQIQGLCRPQGNQGEREENERNDFDVDNVLIPPIFPPPFLGPEPFVPPPLMPLPDVPLINEMPLIEPSPSQVLTESQSEDSQLSAKKSKEEIGGASSKSAAVGCTQAPGVGLNSLWPIYVVGLLGLLRLRNVRKRT